LNRHFPDYSAVCQLIDVVTNLIVQIFDKLIHKGSRISTELAEAKRRSLEANIQFAENAGAKIVRLKGASTPLNTAEYIA